MSKAEKIDDLFLTAPEIANLCDRTDRWVRGMAKDGYFEKEGRGRYSLKSVMRGMLRHMDDQLAKGSQSASASRATDARTREIEQRIAIRERELISIEDATMALDKVVGVVSGELSGLPARISRDLTIRKKAETEVHVARRKISEALAEMSGAARTGIGLDEAGGGADA
jgi:hypothetical protein